MSEKRCVGYEAAAFRGSVLVVMPANNVWAIRESSAAGRDKQCNSAMKGKGSIV